MLPYPGGNPSTLRISLSHAQIFTYPSSSNPCQKSEERNAPSIQGVAWREETHSIFTGDLTADQLTVCLPLAQLVSVLLVKMFTHAPTVIRRKHYRHDCHLCGAGTMARPFVLLFCPVILTLQRSLLTNCITDRLPCLP